MARDTVAPRTERLAARAARSSTRSTAMPDTSSVARRSSPLTRRERTGIVALAVPNLEEPYFAELTTLLARGAEARGLSILIQQTEGDHQREIDVANGVGLPATDGLIHIPRSLTVGDLTRRTDPGPWCCWASTSRRVRSRTCRSTTAAPPIWPPPISPRRVSPRRVPRPRLSRPSDAADQRFTGYRDAVARLGLADEPGSSSQSTPSPPRRGRRRCAVCTRRGRASTEWSARTTRSRSACWPRCTRADSPFPPTSR